MYSGEVAGWYADEADIRTRHWLVQAGQTVVDVGAHFGSYTVPALQAGARVLAVDPNGHRLGVLADVAAGFGVAEKLETCCCALAGPGGYPDDYIDGVIAVSPWQDMSPPAGAEFTTLDKLAARLDALDWVKIDVEGAELYVLQGGEQTLRKFGPRLLIESHDLVYPWVRDKEIKRQCTELLEGLGYQVEVDLYSVYPVREFLVCHRD